MTRAYIGLGANLGAALGALRTAHLALCAHPAITIAARSSIYRSAPVGPAPQPDYLNAVLAVDTTLQAHPLLALLQSLEAGAGRVRDERWGPRSLDLDLLLYGRECIDSATLQVPHPQIYTRNFVLLPLADVCPPDWRFPDGSHIADRCAACPANRIERTGFGWHTAA